MTALAQSLTAPERVRLAELEGVVHRGLDGFIRVGRALAEINNSRLYRETHPNFAEYVREQFGLGHAHAYRMIDASMVCEELSQLSPIGDTPLPRTEGQARELKGLTVVQAAEVMKTVEERTGGRPTARAIKNVREILHPAPKPTEPAPVVEVKPPPELAEKIAQREKERRAQEELDEQRREAHAARCRTLDAAVFLAEEFAQHPARAAELAATYQASNPANPITVARLSAAIHGLKLIREAWQ